jgi:pimeloyl-ACP methyl ester carboxylesterase
VKRFVLIPLACLTVLLTSSTTAGAESICDVQSSGSIYRICMPAAADYNGILVIWAHGFQDAGTPVGIPEDQLCLSGFCINELVNDLGFAFATNSYSKTGLAVVQGKDDIIDLVNVFAAEKGQPLKVYLIGASEGGLITTLAVEERPDLFSGGVAACGPVGSFPLQINYFGDARATFQYFFPTLIPGDPFRPSADLVANWATHYTTVVAPAVFDPANRSKLDQWVRAAKLPYDSKNYLASLQLTVADVLRYAVVNSNDAAETLGGFPFDNRRRLYFGSSNDLLLNLRVPRVSADPEALAEMEARYTTSGVLARPLITIHTLDDQQVPFAHEPLYDFKTLLSGSWLTRHVNLPINRFGHCNITEGEALFAFGLMLFYDQALQEISGLRTTLAGSHLKAFERRARALGVPFRRGGTKLTFLLKSLP